MKPQNVTGYDAKYDTYFKLLSFIETMEGKPQSYPVITPRTEYVPADIVEFVEGALNLEYTDPGLTWEDYDNTIDTFEIIMTSGHAGRVALEALYDEVLDSASAFFYRISETDKFPYLFDVININATSSLLTISVEQIVGKVHRDPTPFGENDYWSIFAGDGLCDPADDLHPAESNASALMSNVITDYLTQYGCVFWSGLTLYSDEDLDNVGIDDHYNWGADNPNETAGDWVIDFRTLVTRCEHGTSECSDFVDNGVYCLAPEEMNYYFQSILGIYADFSSATDLEHRTSGIGLIELNADGDDLKYWGVNVYFGIRNFCFEGNDFPFALPICC